MGLGGLSKSFASRSHKVLNLFVHKANLSPKLSVLPG
jgi:hypothetical protein